jgi:hypothetical protein
LTSSSFQPGLAAWYAALLGIVLDLLARAVLAANARLPLGIAPAVPVPPGRLRSS